MGVPLSHGAGLMRQSWTAGHRVAVRWLALLLPVVVGLVLVLVRDSMSAAAAAMVLVLAVVAAAATGDRVAGVVAALSAAASFDFFLTVPYYSLAITYRDDVQLAVSLVVVGLAVTEIAIWGRRQQAAALRRDGYLQGLAHLLDLPPQAGEDERGRVIAAAVTQVLGADRTEWVAGLPAADDAVVGTDGQVRARGAVVDVRRLGLPTESYTAIPVRVADRPVGHFRVVTSTRMVRPSAEQLRVAMLLADRMGVLSSAT